MELFSSFSDLFANDRLGANLIAVHGTITATVLISLILRRLVIKGGSQLIGRVGQRWLEAASEEAIRRARSVPFWLTVGLLVATAFGGIVYHLAGRDIRLDMGAWCARLTLEELWVVARAGGELLALALAAWFAVRGVRRLGPVLETQIIAGIGSAAPAQMIRQWFLLLQHYAVMAIRLLAIWATCYVVGLGEVAGPVVAFLLRVLTIVVVARLAILSCRVLFQTIARVGDRYLGNGAFRRYWERVRRLFPFGERCFEAAVYITATTLGVRELHFIAAVADFGPKLVQCIGIFFVTRVLIELWQVLLCEALGQYPDEETADQKGRTLLPLLHSVGQYVLYFGSALVMLNVLGIDTRPILAGAGIVGLAVGLGSQSLVTDVVSGFFILFENQYLVGDFVQVGEAIGIVEEVGIRVTQIRDGQGKLHIIPNGAIKGVVSYSKGYINAVIDLRVPAGGDLEKTFRALAEAGRRLRQLHREVLADTQIQGLVDLGAAEMTVRAVTKVRPGSHILMQNDYRRLLKQVLDQEAAPPLGAARAA